MIELSDFLKQNRKILLSALAVSAAALCACTKGKSVEQKNAVESVVVACKTTKGDIDIVVHPEWAPLGASRFLQMVDEGFFNHVPLFRCVDNFLCQFGAVLPSANARVYPPIPDDPKRPDLGSFKRGFLSFAGSGPNSRATHMFITLGENVGSLGREPWETPFGYVTPESMERTVAKFYTQYGDIAPWGAGPDPQKIGAPDGAQYLQRNFPLLDYIESCSRGGVR